MAQCGARFHRYSVCRNEPLKVLQTILKDEFRSKQTLKSGETAWSAIENWPKHQTQVFDRPVDLAEFLGLENHIHGRLGDRHPFLQFFKPIEDDVDPIRAGNPSNHDRAVDPRDLLWARRDGPICNDSTGLSTV